MNIYNQIDLNNEKSLLIGPQLQGLLDSLNFHYQILKRHGFVCCAIDKLQTKVLLFSNKRDKVSLELRRASPPNFTRGFKGFNC